MMALVIDGEKNTDKETIITISLNEESSDVEKVEKVAEVTINKEDKNSGTVTLKVEIEGVKPQAPIINYALHRVG